MFWYLVSIQIFVNKLKGGKGRRKMEGNEEVKGHITIKIYYMIKEVEQTQLKVYCKSEESLIL